MQTTKRLVMIQPFTDHGGGFDVRYVSRQKHGHYRAALFAAERETESGAIVPRTMEDVIQWVSAQPNLTLQ